MDPVINSLVQSPLVRSMSTVPSKASSFVHGVRDNVPPFSFQKVVVQAWNNPSQTSQDQSHKFRVPQFGTLNRAYLRIKTVNQVPTDTSTTIPESDYDTLHVKGSADAAVSTNYDTFKGKFRIPWMHKSQYGQQGINKGVPFGSGGTANIDQQSVMDPELGAVYPANEILEMSTGIQLSDPLARLGNSSNAWNVVNVLDEIRLTTNGKLIETLYGETIPAEVVKMPQQLRDFYIKGMTGWACGDRFGVAVEPTYEAPWDPSACRRDGYGRYQTSQQTKGGFSAGFPTTVGLHNQHANFIVPVTLSSLKSLPKNYQTRFVEDLEIEVKMKELARGFNEFASGVDLTRHHEVELVLIYHNWHDNIENTIRNSNYKRGVPASVYSTNWVRAATTAKVVSDSLPLAIPLTSRNLITELVIVARALKTGVAFADVAALASRKSDYTIFPTKEFTYNVELTGSGKTIWSSTNKELHGPDTADYDLVERKLVGGDGGYGGSAAGTIVDWGENRGVSGVRYRTAPTGAYTAARLHAFESDPDGHTHGGVDYSYGDNMAIMRFGFQTNDEFYSGGVALQTISNPTIKITPPASFTDDGWVGMGVEFDVYVKHSNLVRIDSDTGAVTRTLDV